METTLPPPASMAVPSHSSSVQTADEEKENKDVLQHNQNWNQQSVISNQCHGNQQSAGPNSDYMGLALKQWSVYLGNVLLNFIHKECKNHKQPQLSNRTFCQYCHYNHQHHLMTNANTVQAGNYYCNYANFLSNQYNGHVSVDFVSFVWLSL